MIRVKIKSLLIILSIVLLSAVFVQPVSAERQYSVNSYKMNIEIKSDGSADIEEKLTYTFYGSFNGVLRDIDTSDSAGMNNLKVYVVDGDSPREIIQGTAERRGSYTLTMEGNLAKLKIFEPSVDTEKTFIYRYRLAGVVTRYNDTAEFNRKVIDTGWQVGLSNIQIKITVPEGANDGELKVFGHGPLTGLSKILDNRSVEFTIPAVMPGEFAEARLLFPPNLVPDSVNYVDSNKLEEILQQEASLADEANAIREEARREVEQRNQAEAERMAREMTRKKSLEPFGAAVAVMLFLGWLFIIIGIYRKYDKEARPSFTGKYFRELPGTYTPAEVSWLMFSNAQPKDIMATLLDLVRKKQLLLREVKYLKEGLFRNKELTTYEISRDPNASQIELKKHEGFLIEWFVDFIGNGQSVTLEDIKGYAGDRKDGLKFKKNYDIWVSAVKTEFDKLGFYDNSIKRGKIYGTLAGLGIAAAGALAGVFLYAPAAFANLFLGVALMIYSVAIRRKTAEGNEQFVMWKAFKRFLKDFSNLEHAVVPSLVIWEYYLVYAVSLGVANDVIRQLPLVFREEDMHNSSLTFLYGAQMGYFSGFTGMFENTMNAVQSAVTSAESIANSANSSGSGGGGGFSGGSSGGGGGGGGGGAF